MRDPMTWSFPLGRMFGINVRVHVMLPLLMLALVLRVTAAGVPLADALAVVALMFGSILLHEFGHCFAARSVDGDATEVLLWPLGGLAYCDLPHTPKAHLVCALGGPFVNVLLCVFAAGALAFAGLRPTLNPLDSQYAPHLTHWRTGTELWAHRPAEPESAAKPRGDAAERIDAAPARPTVSASAPALVPAAAPAGLALWQCLAAQLFWVNWLLLLLNMLPGFPLDGGRVLQAILWMKGDYRQAMATAAYAGFFVMLVVGVYSIVTESVLGFALALFVYVSCKQQLIVLESGGEDSPFGYDFSQGYTSLEDSTPAAPPKRRRPNFIQRWLQRRAAKRTAHAMEQRESDEQRMDELLAKVQREGLPALTDEERRFLTRVSARYRGNKS